MSVNCNHFAKILMSNQLITKLPTFAALKNEQEGSILYTGL